MDDLARRAFIERTKQSVADSKDEAKRSKLIEFAQRCFGSRLSLSYLTGAVNTAISNAVASGKSEQTAGEELLTALEQFQDKHKVLIPLSGVKCEVPSLKIAQVGFIHMDGTNREKLRQELLPSYPARPAEPDKTSAHTADPMEQSLQEIADVTCLVWEGVSDYEKAREQAFLNAQYALTFLRYYASFVYSEVQDPVIDYLGNYIYDFWEPWCIILGPKITMTRAARHPGRDDLIISEEAIEKIYALGLDHILKMLEPDALNSAFDELILGALGWFSSGSVPTRPENRLLNYVTSLEMFLSRSDGPVAQSVSEGAALLIADDWKTRKAIVDEIATFYKQRNVISHRGQLIEPIISVLPLRIICRDFILKTLALRSFFKTKESFLDYVQQTRLSGARPF